LTKGGPAPLPPPRPIARHNLEKDAMSRLTLALAVLLCGLAPALAVRAPYHGRLRSAALPEHLLDASPLAADKDGLAIGPDTEVLLDGKACRYEDVPRNAEVTLIDLSADQKVVRKIHFRTRK
jgi:hypothetical protein